MANANDVQLAIGKRTSFTDDTYISKNFIPIVSDDLTANPNIVRSQTITPSGGVKANRRTSFQVGGSISVEAIPVVFKDLILAAIRATSFTPSAVQANVGITSTETISFDDNTSPWDAVNEDTLAILGGFTNIENNRVVIFTDATDIEESNLVVETAAAPKKLIIPGVASPIKTYTFFDVERYTPVGLANNYQLYTQCAVDTWNITQNMDGIVTMSFGLVGTDEQHSGTVKITSPTAVPAACLPMDTANDVNGPFLKVPGDNLHKYTGATQFNLEVQNNVRALRNFGFLRAQAMRWGQHVVTGSFTQYFETRDLFNTFRNFELISIITGITDYLGGGYVVRVPAARLSQARVVNEGVNGDVTANFNFEAEEDSSGKMIYVYNSDEQ